jgi:hypothetical protein
MHANHSGHTRMTGLLKIDDKGLALRVVSEALFTVLESPASQLDRCPYQASVTWCGTPSFLAEEALVRKYEAAQC